MASDFDDDGPETVDPKQPGIGEAIKKVFAVGMSAAFMTEESIRSALGEVKLPKELLKSLIDNANRSKEDILERVSNETVRMIQKIDFVKEASRFVETHKFKISAEIEVEKKPSVAADKEGK